jgi:hypothetical protein
MPRFYCDIPDIADVTKNPYIGLMNKKPPYAIHYAFIRQSTGHVSAPTGHHQVFKKQYL